MLSTNFVMIGFLIFWIFIFFFVLGPCLVRTQLFEETLQENRSKDEHASKDDDLQRWQCSVVRETLVKPEALLV